jgi:hypothetical protein
MLRSLELEMGDFIFLNLKNQYKIGFVNFQLSLTIFFVTLSKYVSCFWIFHECIENTILILLFFCYMYTVCPRKWLLV